MAWRRRSPSTQAGRGLTHTRCRGFAECVLDSLVHHFIQKGFSAVSLVSRCESGFLCRSGPLTPCPAPALPVTRSSGAMSWGCSRHSGPRARTLVTRLPGLFALGKETWFSPRVHPPSLSRCGPALVHLAREWGAGFARPAVRRAPPPAAGPPAPRLCLAVTGLLSEEGGWEKEHLQDHECPVFSWRPWLLLNGGSRKGATTAPVKIALDQRRRDHSRDCICRTSPFG